jgi:hypothetical protein
MQIEKHLTDLVILIACYVQTFCHSIVSLKVSIKYVQKWFAIGKPVFFPKPLSINTDLDLAF